ncbi:MAG: glycosyltransferase family 2 protein [Gammaproteobacteria bacterium]|nr:glycosyltransferase family 2 protein [Gammaproteobacteria bacterium]
MTEFDGNIEYLSIGIVTFNNAQMIEDTIRSLQAGLNNSFPSKIYIFDNGSADKTVEVVKRLAAQDQRIHLMISDKNLGFGGGHNRILDEVDGIYHIICNPDINLTENAVGTLLRVLRDDNKIAIACPRVHFPDGSLQPLNHRNPTILDLFLRRFAPSVLYPIFKRRMQRYEMLDIGYDTFYSVPAVSGAFMACRTNALKEVGGFDERYFLYFEDTDLSRVVQKHGWHTLYCPTALVIHVWRREAHKSIRGAWHFVCSAFRYFNKWGWELF